MTDKNRDFSQIRVGTVVSFERALADIANKPAKCVFRNTHSVDLDLGMMTIGVETFKRWNGYIVSQPEEQAAPDQASVRTREKQIAELSTFLEWRLDTRLGSKEWATKHALEAEKRGDAAGYARRVAEEGERNVTYQIWVQDGSRGYWKDVSKSVYDDHEFEHSKAVAFRSTTQPDTRDGTIAELLAKVATLREALKWIAESVPFVDGAMSLRRRATNALAATGDE